MHSPHNRNIDKLVTRKITENTQLVQIEQLEVICNNKSYADTMQNKMEDTNLAHIIKESKNNDLVQEKARELRSSNLIIYGVDETTENVDSLKTQDEDFMSLFLDTIGVTSRPKQIMRLGKPDNNKKQRPIKVIMSDTAEKELVMSRLTNLKNAEEVYRKCSVRDDYTFEERDLIREWVKKAEEKNKQDNTLAWKVRGTPKNGLRLVYTKQR